MSEGAQKMAIGPVIVIDDEPEILSMVCDLLEDDGYPALCFDRPCRAESIEEEQHPCLFLVDLALPGINGIDLARRLRLVFSATPMIAMSASPSLLNAAQKSGLFQATLPKPFDVLDLLDTVEYCTL